MTLEQSVEFIEYAYEFGELGDTVIPKLILLKLIDLIEIFSKKYNKPVRIIVFMFIYYFFIETSIIIYFLSFFFIRM